MQVQHEQSQEETIQALQRQVDELSAVNRLLKDQLVRREQFTAMIAHELSAPISPIINYAQMLTRTLAKEGSEHKRNEAIQRNANIIVSQGRRLNRLVKDLLDASRLSSGQFTLLREPCDLVALAIETIEQLRPLAPYHTIKLETSQESITGNWDPGRLQQAIGNLIDNAIKYSDEHTTITIHLWITAETAHLSVHNQGVDIQPADSEQLFRPYSRLQTTRGTRPGSGLGLYITKSIIEAHDGSLRHEPHLQKQSSEQGQWQEGTTFSFDLPL